MSLSRRRCHTYLDGRTSTADTLANLESILVNAIEKTKAALARVPAGVK